MTNPYSNLSEEERLQQIAELLATGAIRYLRRLGPVGDPIAKGTGAPTGSGKVEVWDLVEDETEKLILRFLQQRIVAEPILMRTALGLSPMTLTRKLARLRSAGLVRVCGKTRNATYELAPGGGRN